MGRVSACAAVRQACRRLTVRPSRSSCQCRIRPRSAEPCGAGTETPASVYSFSLLRRVRIEMPRMLAAWVRLPRQWLSVSRISCCSTSATVWPTKPRVAASAAMDGGLGGAGARRRRGRPAAGRPAGGWRPPRSPAPLGQQHRAVHGVFQLADVAGPAVGGQAALGAPADSGRSGTPLAAAYFLTKCSARARMSPGRSRSGGRRRFTTFRR